MKDNNMCLLSFLSLYSQLCMKITEVLSQEDQDKLLAQIDREYQEGFNYVVNKRNQYRDRVIRWNKQSKDINKININMIANATDTLIASSYTDWLTVNFASADGWVSADKADNLNYMAEFDNNEEDYQQLYYQKEQDRYFFGVWIRYRYGWDDVRKMPKFLVINPLSWIPDPLPSQLGNFDGSWYRFHWFEFTTTIMDLMADDSYDREQLDKCVGSYFSPENQQNWVAYAAAYNYVVPSSCNDLKTNFSLDVYHHFTNFNGKKYIVTLTNARRLVLRIKELKPILKEEKENPNMIEFPIILNYWKPRRNDPFGESICDKLDDKQIAKTILFNLNIIKAKKEALGGDFIWNSRLIKNKDDILKPTTNGRNIFVDTVENLSNVGMEIPRSQIKADSINMIQALDNEAMLDTNIDTLQQGIVSGGRTTATESQIAQANSNIIGLLNNKINAWWDKRFRFEWWKGYQENFSKADKKSVVLVSNFEIKSFELGKDDFFTKQIPHIILWTKADLQSKNEKEQIFRDKYLWMVLNNPSVPDVSKRIAQRMCFRCNWKTPNEINVLVPLENDETVALGFVEMVNMWEVPRSIFSYPKEYLRTFWVYIQKAENNKAKDVVLQALRRAMINLPLQSAVNPAFTEMANSSSNIAMSQAMQWADKKITSRQDLIPWQWSATASSII